MTFTTVVAATVVFASAKSSCVNNDTATSDDVYKDCNVWTLPRTSPLGSHISTFDDAVWLAGLVDTLIWDGPFTIFAPSNKAFEELPAGIVDSLLMPENKATLLSLLNYHVLPKQVRSKDWEPAQVVKTVGGETLHVVVDATGQTCPQQPGSKEPVICVSVGPSLKDMKKQVATSEFLLSNAAVYLIDGVILPDFPQFMSSQRLMGRTRDQVYQPTCPDGYSPILDANTCIAAANTLSPWADERTGGCSGTRPWSTWADELQQFDVPGLSCHLFGCSRHWPFSRVETCALELNNNSLATVMDDFCGRYWDAQIYCQRSALAPKTADITGAPAHFISV